MNHENDTAPSGYVLAILSKMCFDGEITEFEMISLMTTNAIGGGVIKCSSLLSR